MGRSPHTYAGTPAPDAYNRIAWDLYNSGHGSSAIVQVAWPDGSGHAFNAVNYHGHIVWVDTQSGMVSTTPIHQQAAGVWYIPLDSDRNPLHPAQPDPAQPAQSNQPETQTPAQPQPQPEPGDPGDADADGTPPPDPAAGQSLHDIRAGLEGGPGGLRPPYAVDQLLLEEAVPRNPDGTPQRHPDPFQSWSGLQNDGGPIIPGRSNNCADCTRSFLETWFGNPQVSAPRTWDPNPDGSLDRRSAERQSSENMQAWAGDTYRYSPTRDEGYQRIADELLAAGPGAAAVIAVEWPGAAATPSPPSTTTDRWCGSTPRAARSATSRSIRRPCASGT